MLLESGGALRSVQSLQATDDHLVSQTSFTSIACRDQNEKGILETEMAVDWMDAAQSEHFVENKRDELCGNQQTSSRRIVCDTKGIPTKFSVSIWISLYETSN